jgi:16S rRNA (uracil1498-N3)-methyltransferase
MRRFYIKTDSISNARAVITGQEARHLGTVLRLAPGDRVELVDGRGTLAMAEIETISHNTAVFTILDTSLPGAESPVQITLAQGMLKDKKMDMLVRHLTELGICQWVPFYSSRSIPKPDAKRIGSRMERWNKIAREALKQCGRSMLPLVGEPIPFDQLLETAAGYDARIAFWENATAPIPVQKPSLEPIKKVIVLIGPEGGFSSPEIDAAREKGFTACSLGPRILRAETASLTAAALVQYLFGDLGKNNP